MNRSDLTRDYYMLHGSLAEEGYDWWWHSFTAHHNVTGEERAFFIEYFVMNPAVSPDIVVKGQQADLVEPVKPSYFMVKCGTWGAGAKQLHEFYPVGSVKIAEDRLEITAGENYLSETKMMGNVSVSVEEAACPENMCNAGSMRWNLDISKKVAYNVGYGASKALRKLNAFEMFWHAEGMKTEYSGSVFLDGEEYIVAPENCYGYADKNWGKDFTSPWVWISSCNMKSLLTNTELDNSVIEIGGGRPKIAGYAMDRRLLIDFYLEGKEYEFNFSKPWTKPDTRFNCYETDTSIVWQITTKNAHNVMQVKCKCPKSEMLLINYEAPDGVKRHNRLWNGGTGTGEIKLYHIEKRKRKLVDHISFANAGCEWGEYDEQ